MNVPQLLAGGAADFGIGSNGFIALNLVKAECAHPRGDGDLPERPAGPDQPSAPRSQFAGRNARPADADFRCRHDQLLALAASAQIRHSPTARSANTPSIWRRSWSIPTPSRRAISPASPSRSSNKAISRPRFSCSPITVIRATPTWCWCRRNGSTPIPRRCRPSIDASRDGWYDYLNGNPAPANALIKRDNPDMTDAIIAQAIDKMKQYGLVSAATRPRSAWAA